MQKWFFFLPFSINDAQNNLKLFFFSFLCCSDTYHSKSTLSMCRFEGLETELATQLLPKDLPRRDTSVNNLTD